MSASLQNTIFPEVLRTIDSATFTGSYQAVGTPLLYPCRIWRITNLSNQNVLVSWDGINAHDVIANTGILTLDVASNREVSQVFEIPAGTQFYVSGPASGSNAGLVYIASYYSLR